MHICVLLGGCGTLPEPLPDRVAVESFDQGLWQVVPTPTSSGSCSGKALHALYYTGCRMVSDILVEECIYSMCVRWALPERPPDLVAVESSDQGLWQVRSTPTSSGSCSGNALHPLYHRACRSVFV